MQLLGQLFALNHVTRVHHEEVADHIPHMHIYVDRQAGRQKVVCVCVCLYNIALSQFGGLAVNSICTFVVK